MELIENEKPKKPPTQHEKILNWFKQHKKLNRIQAREELRLFELSARICELEAKGHEFIHEPNKVLDEYGRNSNCINYIYVPQDKFYSQDVPEPQDNTVKQIGLGIDLPQNENNFW